jgi:hypothetical protein
MSVPSSGVKNLFPAKKTAGTWRLPTTSTSVEVKERIELYLYSLLGLCHLL